MDLTAALTALALVAIAMVAGGAIVRVVALGGAPASIMTLGGAAVLVAGGLVWGARGRGRTPYWP